MPITQPPSPISRLHHIRGFLWVFFSLFLVLAIIGGMHYYTFYTTERTSIEAMESLNVDLAQRMIEKDINDVVGDLLFLAEHIELRGLPEALPWSMEQQIVEEFRVFAKNKKRYDQIRYLDNTGKEVVRINYNNDESSVVLESKLQNKANRYYFREALALDRRGIYLSRFDLNVEEGEIEYPLKPMMRFGTPVTNRQGDKRGIILLNYLGEQLIQNFTRAAANIADHIELINKDGFWLSSPYSDDEWGFMLGHNARIQNKNPFEWMKINDQESGQFQTANGLFTFTTIRPLNTTTGDYWKIVSRVSSRQLSATLPLFIRNHYALYLSMLMLITAASWLISRSQQHHRAAEAQRDYEQRFRFTLENMELAAVALNLRGEVTFCNDHFLQTTGWRREEVIGQDWLQMFLPPELIEEVGGIITSMNNPSQFPSLYETPVKARNGGTRLIAWNNTLSFDAEGEVIGVTGIGEDITDKRKAETELLKLYQAVQQSPSIVVITDGKGRIEYVNPKFTEVSGYEPEEVIGQNPRFLKSGETSLEEYRKLWGTVLEGGEWRGEFHNRRKNGELYWEGAVISGIRNPDGQITHFLAVKEDITERKRLEAEVEQQNRELAHAETLAAMGRMASMIAHDLRNPLSSVKMTLQILSKQPGLDANLEVKGDPLYGRDPLRYADLLATRRLKT